MWKRRGSKRTRKSKNADGLRWEEERWQDSRRGKTQAQLPQDECTIVQQGGKITAPFCCSRPTFPGSAPAQVALLITATALRGANATANAVWLKEDFDPKLQAANWRRMRLSAVSDR